MNLPDKISDIMRENVPLSSRTTWKIGGAVEWLAEPRNEDELQEVLAWAADAGQEFRILGGGSNILVNDGIVHGVAIRFVKGCLADGFFDPETGRIECGAGMPLSRLVRDSARLGFGGLESLNGIPGTVGGAVIMNAGSGGTSIGDFVKAIHVLDESGNSQRLAGNEIEFFYRCSNLGEFIVCEVELELPQRDSQESLALCHEALEKKKASQPLDKPSCGCVFKNPDGDSAGRLIDESGCKGWNEGDCQVSEKHANFFINHGRATCADALRLIDRVRVQVDKTFNVSLELEVCLWK